MQDCSLAACQCRGGHAGESERPSCGTGPAEPQPHLRICCSRARSPSCSLFVLRPNGDDRPGRGAVMIRSRGPDLAHRRAGAWGGGFEFSGDTRVQGAWNRTRVLRADPSCPPAWRGGMPCSMPLPRLALIKCLQPWSWSFSVYNVSGASSWAFDTLRSFLSSSWRPCSPG